MRKFFVYLKTRPIALISFILICVIYLIMIFADFFAPYSAVHSFDNSTFHPKNVRISEHGFEAREYRCINSLNWKYVPVKGKEFHHKISFFVHGDSYKILGLIKSDLHLFGLKDSNQEYPVFLLGADNLGRDLFSRIVLGSRISLTIGFIASFISLFLAVLLGGVSGFYGGLTDWSIMRLSEFFMLIPSLYLILFLRSLLNTNMDSGKSYMIITLILSLVGWPGSARTVRGLIHSIKREEFVQNAQLEGIPGFVIIFKYIVPQMASLLIVSTALSVPGFIMSETTLSYLGLGISDPAVSWGSLINRDISTLSNLKNYPWLLNPVYLLLIVTLSFNFLGDALRDFFDPYHAVFFSFKDFFKFKKNKKSASKVPADKNNVFGSVESELSAKRNFLSVENLFVDFEIFRGTKTATVHSVRGVSFSMEKGTVLGIVGESGSGKSVTTSCIPRLLPGNAKIYGEIYFEGKNVFDYNKNQLRNIRGKKIGIIFQEPGRSFDPLQNMGNVFFETLKNSNPKITREASDLKAVELLQEVGLPNPKERLVNYPHQFSGGQLQRISIALSLAQGCSLLIADEPTTALDVTIQAQIVNLLLELKNSRGLSIIFISHNINLVSQISDRMIVMYGGKIMEEGISSELMNNPRNPYTKCLLESTPKFGMHYSQTILQSIPGKVTDPANPEPGCPFAPRCPVSKSECINICDPQNCCPML